MQPFAGNEQEHRIHSHRAENTSVKQVTMLTMLGAHICRDIEINEGGGGASSRASPGAGNKANA